MNVNKEIQSVWPWIIVGLAIVLFAVLFWLAKEAKPKHANIQNNVAPQIISETKPVTVVNDVNQEVEQEVEGSVNIEGATATQEEDGAFSPPDTFIPTEELDPADQDS